MGINRITGIIILIVLFWGCKSAKVSQVVQNEKAIALSASESGDFNQAVSSWQAYFDKHTKAMQEIGADEYARAASDAYKTENTSLTVAWYDAARQNGYSGEDMHLVFVEIFRKQNNLSREMTSLNYLAENFPETSSKKGVYPRLFEIYTEIDKQMAVEMWNKLDKSDQSRESNLNLYFILNKSLDNNAVVDSLADAILILNPKHVDALEWNGEKYYWLAENRYQREMEKYNKSKTHVQYQFLLNELKIVSEDFKQSRDYFEKLWDMKKLPRYASFLSNIYARLDNRERAQFYRKYVE